MVMTGKALRHIIPFLFAALMLSSCAVKNYPSNSLPVRHDLWDKLVQQHVSSEGWVDYPGFLRDSSRLHQYLELLKNNHPNDQHWTPQQQLAYWINAYNAFTVKLIIDHYPLESIKDIKNGIPFVNTVWDIKFIQIEGATYDLNNIEHGIIRAKFDEPRIHFAVNCASKSCPRLRNEAYTADRLDEQLTDQARAFLEDPSKNVVSPEYLQLSRIFQWYRGDFTGGGSFIDFLNLYAPVTIEAGAKVNYLDYDWTLNELPPGS